MLLGGRPASTREQMRQVLELEVRLASITVPQDQRRDEEKIYHKLSIVELQVGQAGRRVSRQGPAPGADLPALLPAAFLRQPGLSAFAYFPESFPAALLLSGLGHLSLGHPLVPFHVA